jgi:hypothetical protein
MGSVVSVKEKLGPITVAHMDISDGQIEKKIKRLEKVILE